MRASLASATSLLALLLLEGRGAMAVPVITAGVPEPFYYVLGRTWEAGANAAGGGKGADAHLFTPLTMGAVGAGVTMTGAAYGGFAPSFRISQSALADLTGSVAPPGNRDQASALNGAANAGNSVFVGTSGFALLDAPSTLPSAASATFAYTISPGTKDGPNAGDAAVRAAGDNQAAKDGPLADPGRDDIPTVTIINPGNRGLGGDKAQDSAARSVTLPAEGVAATAGDDRGAASAKPAATAATGFIYTPLGRSMLNRAETGRSDNASGPVFAGTVPGASVFNTRDPLASGGMAGSAPVLTSSDTAVSENPSDRIGDDAAKAFYHGTERGAGEANHSATGSAVLTVDGYVSIDADPSSFSILSLSDGSAEPEDATVPIPLMVITAGNGELPSSLMIFSPETTGVDGGADAFSYFLNRAVVP